MDKRLDTSRKRHDNGHKRLTRFWPYWPLVVALICAILNTSDYLAMHSFTLHLIFASGQKNCTAYNQISTGF